jgi:hypothetical protein
MALMGQSLFDQAPNMLVVERVIDMPPGFAPADDPQRPQQTQLM